jgi:plastocyanin
MAVCGVLAGVGAANAAQQADETVQSLVTNQWDKQQVDVNTGDTVTWVFPAGTGFHNVAGCPASGACPDAPDDAWEALNSLFDSQPVEFTFTQPGSYEYFCKAHEEMRGTVTVTGEPVETPDPGEPTPSPTSAPPPPVPTATVDPPDDHLSTPAPTGSAATDSAAPAITGLKLNRIKRGARVTFSLSETASVTLSARKGERTVRTLRLQVRSGEHRVKVRRLRKGRHTFALQARDAAGNRSETVSSSIRVRRK